MSSKKYLVNLDLNKNELQNAVIQNLATAPSSPVDGQIYYNTSDDTLYFWNGTSWVNFVQTTQVTYNTFSNRPAANSVPAGTLFYATDTHLLYLSDASNWSQISQFGTVSQQTNYGDTSSSGTSNDYARADHTHGTPSLSTNTPQSLAVGGSGSAGTGTLPSKDDHVHALPGFGSVSAQTTFGASSANGSASTIARSDHTHGTPVHDNAAHSAINLSALAAPTGNVSWGSYKITSLQDPSSAQDAATKAYVDSVAQGLNVHEAVAAGTTASLATITGGTVTYNNGTSGVGATLTLQNALTTLDTTYTVVSGDRLMIKNESTQANNGIYTIDATLKILTRATDFDTTAEMGGGDFFFVLNGQTLDNTGWVCVDKVTTVGTTPVVFSQFSGTGTYTAGNGLTLSSNQFSAVADTGISVSSSGIAINTAVVVTKYSANVGNGSSTSITVSHNLGTRDVIVSVYDNSSPYAEVVCDVEHTSTSAITLNFSVAPTSNQYRVVVHA